MKFEVIDTRIGILEENIAKLGLPYQTFDHKNLNKNKIGLGLTICKELIGLLGPSSKNFISSVFKKGSKFGFLINSK